jgi:hypothetical protein
MHLREYLAGLGDVKAARLFKVSARTAKSWRLGYRIPRPHNAERIVKLSPVTYEGIYGPRTS